MPLASGNQDRTSPSGFTEKEREQILEELRRIVSSQPFRNSRRYPALLNYVVEKTLLGDCDTLKERTLGVEVLERPLDYDTNNDPAVRFTAGEVRRRLAQFYADPANQQTPVEINLPIGSYVPRFRWRQPSSSTTGDAAVLSSAEHPTPLPEETDQRPKQETAHEPGGRMTTRWRWVLAALLVTAAVSLLVFVTRHFVLQREAQDSSAMMQVWDPLLKHQDQVLISIGRPQTKEDEQPETENTSIKDHILQPSFRISLLTVFAVSRIAGWLESQHKQFRIHESSTNTLQDLRDRPVVLVNGNNNKWSSLLLQPLRFHFVQVGDFSYIEDSKHPENHEWSVNFEQPYLKQTVDYAIVGRFFDPSTHAPVLVAAGISSNGTDAAGEFVVSPEELAALARVVPHGTLQQNFEAVLRVEVIGGNTGAVKVIATEFW